MKGVPKKDHEWDLIIAKKDNKADFNIFFVWEYEQDKDLTKDGADAGTIKGNCIFEDQVGGQVSRQVAHEIGHLLRRNDTYRAANIDKLMYGYTDGGMNIPKSDTNIMNP